MVLLESHFDQAVQLFLCNRVMQCICKSVHLYICLTKHFYFQPTGCFLAFRVAPIRGLYEDSVCWRRCQDGVVFVIQGELFPLMFKCCIRLNSMLDMLVQSFNPTIVFIVYVNAWLFFPIYLLCFRFLYFFSVMWILLFFRTRCRNMKMHVINWQWQIWFLYLVNR